jgi:D-glycero-D-manno-heptose 1,7-bisphosphate phosphatase
VLNDAIVREGKPYPPTDLGDFRISDGVAEACGLLKKSGFELVVVTNQPDVSRGKTTISRVEEFHEQIRLNLGIQHFYTCYHDDADECPCRKPSRNLGIDLEQSYLVGDRWRDIDAGNSAGCKSIFVDHSFLEKQPKNYYSKVSSLLEAVPIILGV